MGEVLYFSKEEIKKCINIKEAINAVEEGIKALARNEAVQPPKVYMNVKEEPVSFIKPMAAYVKGQYPCVKIFTFSQRTHISMIYPH